MEHDPTPPSSQKTAHLRNNRPPDKSFFLAREPVIAQDLDELQDPRLRLSLHDLEVVSCLGIGGFGNVVLVHVRQDVDQSSPRRSALFAMKTLRKCQLRNAGNSARDEMSSERRALSPLPWNPFVSGVVDAFSDYQNLYFMLEVMPHGVFSSLVDELGPFDPITACFYYCNIFCGLEFIHSHGLVLRDLKPDNILVGHDGYLCLTDFGLAVKENEGGVWQFLGTSSYMAPELIKNLTYLGPTVDWWASGVILYEMLSKQLPFRGSVDETIFANILSLNYCWPDNHLGNSLKHFISRLLTFNPEDRLGFHGAREVASHPWLSHVDWVRTKSRTYEAPWTPEKTELSSRWHHHPLPSRHCMGDLRVKILPVHLRWDKRFRQKKLPN